jgi:hypothetical protein
MVRALVLKVVDQNGEEVKRVEVDTDLLELVLKRKKDLGTDWFGRILAGLFSGVSVVKEVTDENGDRSTRAFHIVSYGGAINRCADRIWDQWTEWHAPVYAWIAVGFGTTPPTRTDTKLEYELDRKPASTIYNDGTGLVIITAAFSFTEEKTISEIGLLLCPCHEGCGRSGVCVLADRTVLESPVVVSANQTLYVEYRIAI